MASASEINSTLTSMQSATATLEAEKLKTEGPKSSMDSDAFLKLMLEQLKYQDPTEPTDNSQFLAQQAQFTQLDEVMKLNDTVSSNAQVSQACSLVGKDVSVINPDNSNELITGTVTSANFSSDTTTIVIGGKEYPLSSVTSVSSVSSTANSTTGSES